MSIIKNIEISEQHMKKNGFDSYVNHMANLNGVDTAQVFNGFDIPEDRSAKLIDWTIYYSDFLKHINFIRAGLHKGGAQGFIIDPVKCIAKQNKETPVKLKANAIKKVTSDFDLTELRFFFPLRFREVDSYSALGTDYLIKVLNKAIVEGFSSALQWLAFNGEERDEDNNEIEPKKVTKGWFQRLKDVKATYNNFLDTLEPTTGDKKLTVGYEAKVVALDKVEASNSKSKFTTKYPHGLEDLFVVIKGTKNYDGSYLVEKGTNPKEFIINKSHTEEKFTNARVIKEPAWKTLDALVVDLAEMIPESKNDKLAVIMSRNLLANRIKYMYNSYGAPSEVNNVYKVQYMVGGYPVITPSYMPKGTIILTNPKNLCLYMHKTLRAMIERRPDISTLEFYRISNIDYQITDLEAIATATNIITF